MAQITIKVSDLTHEPIDDETQAAQLIVEHHPDFQEPITLDVLPQEVERVFAGQEREQQYVVLRYQPQNGDAQQIVMPVGEFNALASVQDMQQVLEAAHRNQQQEQRRQRGGRRQGGRRGSSGQQQRERIDYATREHAGEPHRGRVTDSEKAYVSEHLEEVNKRLRGQGMRAIDPNDPEMVERYGLRPPEPTEG